MAMYGFDPDPTQLNAAPRDSAGRVVLVIHRESGVSVYLWYGFKRTDVCVSLLYREFL